MSTTYTEHYNFGKQENYADLFLMKVITDNWDSLDAILYGFSTGKQDKLSDTNKLSVAFVDFTPAQIAVLGSGITDDDVEQIDLNKKNILYNTDNGVKNILNFTLNHQSGTVAFDNIGNNTVKLTSSAATSAQVTCALYTGEMSTDYYAIKVVASGITLANDNVFVNVVYDIDGGATNQNQNVTDVLVFRNNKIIIKGVYVYVRSGKQPNGTIQVMICPTNLYDVSSKMIPYAMSNAELTSGVLYNTVTGVKNIVNIPDKTLTVSGYDVQDFAVSLPAGTYTFSFNGASLSALVFDLKSGDSELVRVNRAVTAGENHFNFTLYQTANTLNIWFNLATGATSGTITNHMICLKSLYDADPSYQPYALSNAELTAKEQQNESNILLKADKISFGFSGNPNPAVYVKDWDFVPDGTYLLTYICSQDASTCRGVSVYMFTKYTTNHIVLFTPVVEVSSAIITSCVASGSEGAETITFTMAQRGYHTAAAIQIQAF